MQCYWRHCLPHGAILFYTGLFSFDDDVRYPAIKGTIANKGSSEMTVEEVKKITEIASKIFFENNSDKLKVASLVQLDELTTLLKKYENAN